MLDTESPKEWILIDDPVDHLGKKRMEFHLIYAGNLIKSGKRTRAWEKHSIRRHFHDQLKRLWEIHPALQYYGNKTVERDQNGNEIKPRPFLDVMAENYSRANVGMIPIITAANGLVCSLDILLLRGSRPGTIMQGGGDIDNQIKVLVDSLRMPADGNEMPIGSEDEPTPNPLYCLMQDDNLITSLKVKTDRLLFTLDQGQSEACAIVRVETANVDPFGSPWELHL
jgi:hypothetical protein